MKKKDFVTLMMSVVGGILFALGMCMTLLPEWNAMTQGVVIGAVGLVVLLVMLLVRRKMDGKPAIVFNGKEERSNSSPAPSGLELRPVFSADLLCGHLLSGAVPA